MTLSANTMRIWFDEKHTILLQLDKLHIHGKRCFFDHETVMVNEMRIWVGESASYPPKLHVAKPRQGNNHRVVITYVQGITNTCSDMGGYVDVSRCDILILRETGLKPDIQGCEIFPSSVNFNIFQCERQVQGEGGGTDGDYKEHIKI